MNNELAQTPAARYARVSSDGHDVDLSVAAQLRAQPNEAERGAHHVVRSGSSCGQTTLPSTTRFLRRPIVRWLAGANRKRQCARQFAAWRHLVSQCVRRPFLRRLVEPRDALYRPGWLRDRLRTCFLEAFTTQARRAAA